MRIDGDTEGLDISNITFDCPQCGTETRPALPGGIYDVHDGQWQLVRRVANDLKSAQATSDDFVRLVRLLKKAQTSGSDAAQVADEIAAQTPFTQLAQTIREHPPGWIAYILTVILSVLLWLIPSPGNNASAGGADRSPSPTVLQHMSTRELDELAQKIAQ
ncbi:MAG TPA: hypothetical protein VHY21_13820, partial [Pseudonocardiaceae bacterium]|nr:hypothetical protein [Pseudonocardiaceae bacterium]